jgi:DNA-binding transcriptional MerR regulator
VTVAEAPPTALELSVDELARHTGIPVRTIREYQALGVLPPPERRGRIGIYGPAHVGRLQLIGRLQQRGYSLAGIRDLVTSWAAGSDLADVLGLAPDELIHLDEPGAPATLDQLGRLLPDLIPERLRDVISVGLVEDCGPGRYCVPSPSLLQLTVDLLAAGYGPDRVLATLGVLSEATSDIADAAIALIQNPPSSLSDELLTTLIDRGRGLLAHATGRITVHAIGRRLGVVGGRP